MRHHTATHLLNSAARQVLGEHVWQAGAQKDVERSRLDITHYNRLTQEETRRIEELANYAVMKNLPVETLWMPREEAERLYGFRLYQGGVVPGREIRIVNIKGWDVEACGGTHCKTTGEIGLIKILRTERIQDGVERLVFSAGLQALKAIQRNEEKLFKIAEVLEVPVEKVENTTERLINDWRKMRRDRERLIDKVARFTAEKYLTRAKEILGLKTVSQVIEDADMDLAIKIADNLVKLDPKVVATIFVVDENARVVVMVGQDSIEKGVKANEIAMKVASELGGGGSGRPDFAQGGGTLTENLPKALRKVEEFLYEKLQGVKS